MSEGDTLDRMDRLRCKIYEGYDLDPSMWVKSVPAGEASRKTGVSESRLDELAERRLCPHFRVDKGVPMFHVPTLRSWIGENLVETIQGEELPLVVIQKVCPTGKFADILNVPDSMRAISGLRVAGFDVKCSGVYFLCDKSECVYVGQAAVISARVGQHSDKEFERAYYIPVGPANLDDVERKCIVTLLPKYNKCGIAKSARKRKENDRE